MVAGYERLVEPTPGEVDAIGHPVDLTQLSRRARLQLAVGCAFLHDVTHPKLFAQEAFGAQVAILVDDEHVGPQSAEFRLEIENTGAAGDENGRDAFEGLNHEAPFFLTVDGGPSLEVENGPVRAEGDVEFAVFGRRSQKGDVTAVQQVKTTTDEDLCAHPVCSYRGSRNRQFLNSTDDRRPPGDCQQRS